MAQESDRSGTTDAAAMLRKAGGLAWRGLLEAVWPTRCALCDAPGELLCRKCRLNLPYIDQLRACPECGAPWGKTLCSECNSFMVGRRAGAGHALDGCTSLLLGTPEALALVGLYKDRNERRLGEVLGALLGRALPRSWLVREGGAGGADGPSWTWRDRPKPSTSIISWIPARKGAVRKRGFDHAQTLAQACAREVGMEAVALLAAADRRDQRRLTAEQRAQNMRHAFTVRNEAFSMAAESAVILVDDVFTTGATLQGAAHALKEAGFAQVRGATLLRML